MLIIWYIDIPIHKITNTGWVLAIIRTIHYNFSQDFLQGGFFMRITTRGRYALRAALALAEMGKDQEMVSINSLAEAEDIPSVFLEQIFFKLKKAGIVKSARGPGGGFSFNRPLDSLTVKEIFDAAGEELTLMMCDRQETKCKRLSSCISHRIFASVTDKVNDYLDSLTLQMILENDKFRPHSRKAS
jgi:Rrf2 family iron-sulfur cluster assembly transcriptional regulator